MQSKIAGAIALTGKPVAVVLSSEKPEGALQFKEGRWGCVISMLAASSKGRTAVFDRQTAGCLGGAVGLGFGNAYVNFPGGIEYFLSTGNPEFCQTDIGQQIAKQMAGLEEGERYVKTTELAKKFADSLPYIDVPTQYVLFKPLSELKPGEKPEVVVFLVNPDQLSALSVLANYGRENNDNVFAPFGAGCHSVFLLPYREGKNPVPRAIIDRKSVV